MAYGNFHENLRKIFLTHFVIHYLTNQDKNKDEDEKFGKMSSIFEFSISKFSWKSEKKIKWKNYLTISLFNFDYLPDEDGKKIDAKNDDRDGKVWKNEFDFSIFHIKIWLHDNFHENLRTKNLTHSLRHFWLIETKMKMKMKKCAKMCSTFKFSLSKLGFVAILM